MINYDNVMAKADKYYAEIKAERLQCDISLVPQEIQSDQIRALGRALVEEINATFEECDEEAVLSRIFDALSSTVALKTIN
jgi:hypothetical protein